MCIVQNHQSHTYLYTLMYYIYKWNERVTNVCRRTAYNTRYIYICGCGCGAIPDASFTGPINVLLFRPPTLSVFVSRPIIERWRIARTAFFFSLPIIITYHIVCVCVCAVYMRSFACFVVPVHICAAGSVYIRVLWYIFSFSLFNSAKPCTHWETNRVLLLYINDRIHVRI